MEVGAECIRENNRRIGYQERDFSGQQFISIVVSFVYTPTDMVVERSSG